MVRLKIVPLRNFFTMESEFELEDKPFFDYQILEVMVFKL